MAVTPAYAVLYGEILFVCFTIAAVMYAKVSRDLGSERELTVFKWMLRVFMAMMVIDTFTQLHYQSIVKPPLVIAGLAYATYMSLLAILALLWMYYAELQINPQITRSRRFRIVSSLPCLFMVVLCFASLKFGFVFSFDENGLFIRGPLFFVQNIIAYVYIMVTTGHALMASTREISIDKRRRMRILTLFAVAPVIGGLLQLFIGNFPFVGPSLCISTVMIFVSTQSEMINVDALTGLNNRKGMERYIEARIREVHGDETAFWLFMIDADNFKYINDTFGHVEGDRALRIIADALRASVASSNGFIARFGGDEYVAVVDRTAYDAPEQFEECVRENLRVQIREYRILYPLSVTIGYVLCTTDANTVDELIKSADRLMYEKKRIRKTA